jgi:hypothetical protein
MIARETTKATSIGSISMHRRLSSCARDPQERI